MLSDSESTFASIWVKQISDIFIVDLQHAEFDLETKQNVFSTTLQQRFWLDVMIKLVIVNYSLYHRKYKWF